MNFDCIIANPPYGKIGVDVTKNVIKQNPDSNYAMLGTRTAFKKYYDKLACAFVQIGKYELGSNVKLDWGVEQAILLATNGWTEVVDNRKKEGGNKVGVDVPGISIHGHSHARTSHLVGVNEPYVYRTGTLAPRRSTYLAQLPRSDRACAAATHSRSTTLVQMSQGQIPQEAYTRLRSVHFVQVNKSGPYLGAAMDRHTANVTDTKPTDVKLRNGYIYVAFETFEEACECAIDIISWTDPTDSHYRCVRWGFVQGLIAHKKYK